MTTTARRLTNGVLRFDNDGRRDQNEFHALQKTARLENRFASNCRRRALPAAREPMMPVPTSRLLPDGSTIFGAA